MATDTAQQLIICNMALRSIGGPKLTALTDDVEAARILNDVYATIRKEVLAAYPWNFAIKRALLTEAGGLITTWSAGNETNTWKASLAYDPAKVYFDGVEGTEKTSEAACTAENYWYWDGTYLYVYSTSDPDTAYVNPGIDAVIPVFDYSNAFALPSDCLRVIVMEDDEEFNREGDLLVTDATTARIRYIANIDDETEFSPAFTSAFAQRLAAELAFPVSNDKELFKVKYEEYLAKLKLARQIDGQEGTVKVEETYSWLDERE